MLFISKLYTAYICFSIWTNRIFSFIQQSSLLKWIQSFKIEFREELTSLDIHKLFIEPIWESSMNIPLQPENVSIMGFIRLSKSPILSDSFLRKHEKYQKNSRLTSLYIIHLIFANSAFITFCSSSWTFFLDWSVGNFSESIINVIQLFAQPSTKYGLSYEQLSNPISN